LSFLKEFISKTFPFFSVSDISHEHRVHFLNRSKLPITACTWSLFERHTLYPQFVFVPKSNKSDAFKIENMSVEREDCKQFEAEGKNEVGEAVQADISDGKAAKDEDALLLEVAALEKLVLKIHVLN